MNTTTTTPVPFHFHSQLIRVVTDEHGNPWFCAKDCCDVLGYTNDSKAIKDHCISEGVTNRYPLQTKGGIQYPSFISEGNIYRLIIKSNMPSTKEFEAWVCDKVLPSIRKTGRYEATTGKIQDTRNPSQSLQPRDRTYIPKPPEVDRGRNWWNASIGTYLKAATGPVSLEAILAHLDIEDASPAERSEVSAMMGGWGWQDRDAYVPPCHRRRELPPKAEAQPAQLPAPPRPDAPAMPANPASLAGALTGKRVVIRFEEGGHFTASPVNAEDRIMSLDDFADALALGGLAVVPKAKMEAIEQALSMLKSALPAKV